MLVLSFPIIYTIDLQSTMRVVEAYNLRWYEFKTLPKTAPNWPRKLPSLIIPKLKNDNQYFSPWVTPNKSWTDFSSPITQYFS